MWICTWYKGAVCASLLEEGSVALILGWTGLRENAPLGQRGVLGARGSGLH